MTPYPGLKPEQCTRYRYRYSTCSRCADLCPHGALGLGEEGVTLDQARCTGCGLCDGVCPTGVFQAPNIGLAVPADPAVRTLTIACAPSEQTGDLRVSCLGALDIGLLAGLGRRGLTLTMRGSGHCADCTHAPQGAERLQALLDALAVTPSPRGAPGQDQGWPVPILEDEPGQEGGQNGLDRRRAGRRQLFRRWLAPVVAVEEGDGAATEVQATAIRIAPHAVPARRRLVETLWRQRGESLDDPEAGLVWGLAYVEAGTGICTGCEACARVCPTGALKVAEEAGLWQLIATPAQCVGCAVCIEACHIGALSLHQGRRAAAPPWSAIQHLRRYRCERCGRFFVGLAEDGCPVCRDDEDNFADIFG